MSRRLDVKELSKELPIAEEHLEELVNGSGISPDVLRRAGIWTERDPKAASKLLGRGAKYWVQGGYMDPWIVPYRLPFRRDPVRYRGKPAKPWEQPKKDGSVESVKYVEPKGSRVHLYFPPGMLDSKRLKDLATPLWLTEGEKKALSADSHGIACIAVSGVHQWHLKGETKLHPDFAHVALEGREVFIAFDHDALRNYKVRDQEIALGQQLLAAGAKVYIVRFPEDAQKLDDFLVAHELSELAELMDDARKHAAVEAEVQASGAPAPATGMTDLANAERFVAQHHETVRYCSQSANWYVWDGKRWELDPDDKIKRKAYVTARSIYTEADGLPDPDSRIAMRKHAIKTEGSARIAAMVSMAGPLKRVCVRHEAFDADPWLVNCENGIVDLRTGELRDHDRGYLITKVAPVFFDANARHERWDAFIDGISNGDPDVASFLQRAVGYSLTGDTREDKVFVLHGPAGRGKSTFVGAIEAALGDYAKTAATETFLKGSYDVGGDKPRPDLVRLAGARICVCKEVDPGAMLAAGLVKTITGGDTITVRDLHSKPFEYRPTFKLWFVVNPNALVVQGDDDGLWRRVVRVPFERPIPNPDTGLREALFNDHELRAAVFAWAVRGVAMWLRDGLRVPETVAKSTAEYRSEMNHTEEFLEKKCFFDAEARIARKDLRLAYTEWCTETGYSPLGPRRFASALREYMRKIGFSEEQLEQASTGVRNDFGKVVDAWRGVRLANDFELETKSNWGVAHRVHSSGQLAPSDFTDEEPANQQLSQAGVAAQGGATVAEEEDGWDP